MDIKTKKLNSLEDKNAIESKNNDNISDICSEMTEEYSSIEKDISKLKELLTITREARKKDSQILSAKDLLKKYQALNDENLVNLNFTLHISIVTIIAINYYNSFI